MPPTWSPMRKRAATRPDTDFAAGHLELQKRTGAGLSLGAKAQPQYPSPPPRRRRNQVGQRFAALSWPPLPKICLSCPPIQPRRSIQSASTLRSLQVVARGLKPLQDPGPAAVLDVPSPDDFAAGHRPGSLNVGIEGATLWWWLPRPGGRPKPSRAWVGWAWKM